MSSFGRDDNRVPSSVRAGNPHGGCIELDDTVTANTWIRLMPNGNSGALVSGDDRRLNIGTLRADVITIDWWKLLILNAGYKQELLISTLDGQEVKLRQPIENVEGIRAAGIESSIEFIIYPEIINPFMVTNDAESDSRIEIGATLEDQYTVTNVKKIGSIPAGRFMKIPFNKIDRLFYQLPSALTSGQTVELSWGDHYISR